MRSWLAPSLLVLASSAGCGGGGGGGGGGVSAPTAIVYAASPATYTVCEPIPIAAPAVAGGSGTVLTFGVQPPLPAGLALDPATGAITGTPSAATGGTPYAGTVTVSNSMGSADTQVAITVLSSQPVGLSYADPAPTYLLGFPIAPDAASLASGSAESFALAAGALPGGLALDPSTGEISGTPLFETPAAGVDLTVIATSCEGSSAQVGLTIRVERPRSRAVYVANSWDSSVTAYVQDASTGQLRHNGYAVTGLSTHPRVVAASPDGRRLYTATNPPVDPPKVVVYAVDPVTGRIAQIQTLTEGGLGTIAMAVHPAGKFLYVLNLGSDDLSQFAIEPVTGTLTPLAPALVPTGESPSGLALSPGGEYAYVSHIGPDGPTADPSLDSVWTYRVEASGALTLVGQEQAGADPTSVVVTRDGRFAYTSDRDSGTISEFSVDPATGLLVPLGAGSVPAGGNGPIALAATPGSDALYAANSLDSTLSQFQITATGELVPLAPATVPTGLAPVAIAVDPAGEYAYAVSLQNNCVRSYRILPAGELEPVLPFEVRTRRNPSWIVVAPHPTSAQVKSHALYAANLGFGEIQQFALDAGTGILTAKTPVLGGLGSSWIDVHPALPYAYVSHNGGVTRLALGPASELLPGPVLSAPFAGNWSVHAESSGRFVFLVQPGGTQVVRFAVDPSNGALVDPIATASGNQPRTPGLHPNGGFLYVPNRADGTISQFDINPLTGILGFKVPPLAASPNEPTAVVVDPTGRFAYVANQSVDHLSLYLIDSFLGTLAPLPGQATIAAGDAPAHLAMTPNGRFLFAACRGDHTVRVYVAFGDPADPLEYGHLFAHPSGPIAVGGVPFNVATDAAGKFLYVSLETSQVEVRAIAEDGTVGPPLQAPPSGSGTRGIAIRNVVE